MTPVEMTLGAAFLALVAYNVGAWLYKKDDQWERTAEHLLELSTALSSYGLKDIPKGLQLAAIKDVSGVVDICKFYIDLLKRDPAAVMKEFDNVFNRRLDVVLADPDLRGALQAKLIASEAAKAA